MLLRDIHSIRKFGNLNTFFASVGRTDVEEGGGGVEEEAGSKKSTKLFIQTKQ